MENLEQSSAGAGRKQEMCILNSPFSVREVRLAAAPIRGKTAPISQVRRAGKGSADAGVPALRQVSPGFDRYSRKQPYGFRAGFGELYRTVGKFCKF